MAGSLRRAARGRLLIRLAAVPLPALILGSGSGRRLLRRHSIIFGSQRGWMPGFGAKAALLQTGGKRGQIAAQRLRQPAIGRAHRDLHGSTAFGEPYIDALLSAMNLQTDIARR